MKRGGWLVLALMVLFASAAGAAGPAVALNIGDGCVLVGHDGEELVPAGRYAGIEPIGGQAPYLYSAYRLDGEGAEDVLLLDEEGRELTGFEYGDLAEIDGGICFRQGGLYGVMDRALNVVVPCAYTSIVSNGQGGYLALTTDPYDERADGVYYIDSAGAETATGTRIHYGLSGFSGGLMPAISAETGRAGYLSATGEWGINAQFSYGGAFVGAFADAAIDSGAGLIDASGNWLLTPKYDYLAVSGNGSVIVVQSGSEEISLISPDTFAPVRTFTGSDIYFFASPDSDLVTVYLDEEALLVNAAGEPVFSAKGRESTIEFDGSRVILREGEWGEANTYLCDASGERLAGPYQDIWRVSADGDTPYYAFASFETEPEVLGGDESYLNEVPDTRKTGLMDASGKQLWPPDEYRALYSPSEGIFAVETADYAGVVKADGTLMKRYAIKGDYTW